MSAIAEHDYIDRVREEVKNLERELAIPAVAERLKNVRGVLGLPEDLALAAIYRAARRSGLSLDVMLTELSAQLERAGRPR